jgi:dienelactone hydrolase
MKTVVLPKLLSIVGILFLFAFITVNVGADTSPLAIEPYTLGTFQLNDSATGAVSVTLGGRLALPAESAAGGFPVALIVHGRFPICPGDEAATMGYPCEGENRYDAGWDHLLQALAQRGYLALAINVNGGYAQNLGASTPEDRVPQIITSHLNALQQANAGNEDVAFGVDLTGRVDLSRLALIGHSRGAYAAVMSAWDRVRLGESGDVDALMLVTPSGPRFDSRPDEMMLPDVPTSILLAACDRNVWNQHGQMFYETARFETTRQTPVTSVMLEGANHTYFMQGVESFLEDDYLWMEGDTANCTADSPKRLSATQQSTFITRYIPDMLDALLNGIPAEEPLGLDATQPVPQSLYGYPVRMAVLPPAAQRMSLIQPASPLEMQRDQQGGDVLVGQGVGIGYCFPGVACQGGLLMPGSPAALEISSQGWDGMQINLSERSANVSSFDALHFRVALNPLNRLTTPDWAQSISVMLVDSSGGEAVVDLPETLNAFVVPEADPSARWSLIPMFLTSVRIPLSAFQGVDLNQIESVVLLFDRTPMLALYLADLEFVRGAAVPTQTD